MNRLTHLLSSLAGVLAAGILGLAPAAAAAQSFDEAAAQAMLDRINAMRSEEGLEPLSREARLDAAARAHCMDMAAQQQLTHVSQSSGTPADRVRSVGLAASSVAENVALHRTAEQAHQALVASDPHRANMMSGDADHVGLAAYGTEQGVYVTQVFAAVAEPEPEPEPEEVQEAPEAPDAEIELPVPALVAPSLEQAEEPGPEAAGGAPAPELATAPGVPSQTGSAEAQRGAHYDVQPGSDGTVVYERPAPGEPIAAYWVYGSGRWWYYPMPPGGARAGEQLQPDRSVQGPPPGFAEHPNGEPPARAQVPPPASGAPAGRPQARRGEIRFGPFRGRVHVTPPSHGPFYSVPPPPMAGRPTRAWRRAHRRWQRAYRRWLRAQRRAGHDVL